jgi:transcriptional regulator with XRE-family HTH domain
MPTTPTKQTGANIRAEIARRKISQTTLAEHLGLSQTSVSARLSGRTAFDVNEVHAIAVFLGVPLSVLLPSSVTDSVAS